MDDGIPSMAVEGAGSARRARVLIVDDRRENLVLAGYMLEPLGHEILTAQHIDEALTLARRQPPDLILCDVNLVKETGFDLLTVCKADPQLRPIPFILLSAIDCTEQETARGLALGASRIVVRPSKPEALMKLVQEGIKN